MSVEEDFLSELNEPMKTALSATTTLEKEVLANRNEGRMLGQYRLRTPELAPD